MNTGHPNRGHLLAAILLLLLTFALYAPTLFYPFVNFDDPGIVLGNPVLRENTLDAWVSAATERQGGTFLPVRALSYKIDFALTEGNPLVFHAHNVLLAGVLHVLAYFVLLGFFRDPRAALAGAILYAVHPVHVESVAWVTGRKDLLSSILALSALLCFRRARARDSASLAPAALGLFVLAALSKATVLVLPVWLVLEEALASRREGEPARWRRLAGPALFFLAAFFLFVIHYQEARLAGVAKEVRSADEQIRIVAGGLIEHLRLLLLPEPLCARARSGFASPLYLLALPILAIAAVLFRPRQGRPEDWARLGAAWFLVFLLPTANLIRTSTPAADRYLILPSLALALALAPALARRRACAGVVIVVLAALNLARQPTWSDSNPLWKDTLRKTVPRLQTYARIKAAQALTYGNPPSMPPRPEAARRLALAATRASDTAWEVWDHLAAVLFALDRPNEAIQALDQAIRLEPGESKLYSSRARIRMEDPSPTTPERSALVMADLRKAIDLEPENERVWYEMGLRLFETGDPAGAERALSEVLRIGARKRLEPVLHAGAYYLRSQCRRKRTNPAGESEDLDRSLALNPEYSAALHRRAQIRKTAGRLREALQDIDAFFRSPPEQRPIPMSLEAGYLAGTCHALLGEDDRAEEFLKALGPDARARSRTDPDWAGFWARQSGPR